LAVEDFPAICTLGAWMRAGDDHFDGEDIRPLLEPIAIRAAVARGNPVEIFTDIGLSLTYVAMSATLSARRLSFWPPQRFRLCDFVQDWWGYLVALSDSTNLKPRAPIFNNL
jgi:hypothetical protein